MMYLKDFPHVQRSDSTLLSIFNAHSVYTEHLEEADKKRKNMRQGNVSGRMGG
jgi:hypothetical protein